MLVPLAATLSVVMAALDMAPFAGFWVSPNQNLSETRIDGLMTRLHVVAAVVLLGTGITLAWVMWSGVGRQTASAVSHHTALEVVWTLIPAGILMWLALTQYAAWRDSRLIRPATEVAGVRTDVPPTVMAVARRFGWDFHHAGRDGRVGTADDLIVENELKIPGDRDVVVELRSRDVIHNFCVPVLRIKQDVVPGLRQLVWFRTATGNRTEIICTELCGWGHYLMQARLEAIPAADYDAWMQGQTPGKDRP